ncbi:LysR family transcriptional regulator [Ureibacillus acetophenoni]|uniref:LysR family transcriptional regulator n=1 Tax=Ureibacillus acetophenoni TaxID=614649 RepID=A0A285UD58_9BACL|nr:LysR family transcriptional regulator [Ureibacillus acetophenoni]SOC39338.1 LysR family transcriptional regulator [Ureibacillus acetophenoni]
MIGNLDLYRIFNVVSRNKSFSKAAQELYMTQSAVSQAIMKLENELKIQLFYRTSKGIVLTNEGKLLYEYINSALGMINVAEEKILEINKLNTGQLRIAVGDTISRYFLLPYLEDFHARYPGIKLNILNGTTSEICDFIKSGKADVGICNLPIDDENIQIIPCKEVQDIFVCGEKFKKIAEKRVSLEFLMKMPLIFLERKSNSRMYVENFFKKRGYQISPAFELGSHDLVLEFTRINLGISCVVKEFSSAYLESGELHEIKLEEEIPRRSIGICYLKNVPLSRAAGKFVERIHKV